MLCGIFRAEIMVFFLVRLDKTYLFFDTQHGKDREMEDMTRYAVIYDKNPREIVLLRGAGCKWKRCTFCDYHADASADAQANYALNTAVLAHVTGEHQRLEVINSGSFVDLDPQTMQAIARTCREKNISALHMECHWMHRGEIPALRELFAQHGIMVKIKTGVETFDYALREEFLHKGIGVHDPAEIAAPFDECCLLFGLRGQTEQSMQHDIETGLQHFERVCVNLMTENTTAVKPDKTVLDIFRRMLYPLYKDHPRVDILMENTDFGVGKGDFSCA